MKITASAFLNTGKAIDLCASIWQKREEHPNSHDYDKCWK